MATKQLIVSAFVASPSDVGEERALMEEIVTELNLTWNRTLQIRLELIKWETHTTPGIGAYPQQVINHQIGDTYDVLIGILWVRLGTETPNAQSGTLEEFERALKRYREDSNSVEIMFYFKDSPITPSHLDISQFTKVMSFKKSLGDEGVLHWSFSSREEFTQLLRIHLSRVAQRWAQKAIVVDTHSIQPMKGTSISTYNPDGGNEIDNDDLGFFDHIEEGVSAFERSTESLNKINVATNDIGAAMHIRAADMQKATAIGGNHDVHILQKIAKAAAQDMNDFAARLEVEIPLFSDGYQRAMSHIVSAANLSVEDFTPPLDQLKFVRDMVSSNHQSITEAKSHVLSFRQIIAGLPRLQSTFNKAKKRTVHALDDLMDKLDFSKRSAYECAQLLDELIGRIIRQAGSDKESSPSVI
jgi:hypothetical protein